MAGIGGSALRCGFKGVCCGFWGLLWFLGSVAWSWAEILSWMLVVASDPGAELGIGFMGLRGGRVSVGC